MFKQANLRLVSTPLHPTTTEKLISEKTTAKRISCGDSWEELRKLDEEEAWVERTQVVTAEDHILYCDIAKVCGID